MSWLSDLLTGNSSDKRAAERAKKTQEEQKANLLRVSKQAIQTGTPQQQQKAQRILTNKSWTVDSSYKPAYNNDPLKNATGTVGLGLYRSAIGTGQGLSGIYDLATPGKGTNRLSKALDVKAKRADEIAVQQNRSGLGYKGGQFLGDALTFTSGAPVIKGASTVLGTGAKMIPGASKVIAPTTNLVSKVSKPLTAVSTPVSKGIATTTAKLANKGAGGRIAAQAIQTGVSKSQLMNTGVDMGLGLGQMASKGQDIGWKDVALQGGISAGFGVGMPAAAQAVKEVMKPTTKLVTGMARGVRNIDNSFNQKGYLDLGAIKETADTIKYRAEIKKRIQAEADYFKMNKKSLMQQDGSRNMYATKMGVNEKGGIAGNNYNSATSQSEKMFREFEKNPDAFIDKYKLMPPELSGKPKSTVLNGNDTTLNGNEPKLNVVEREITETEPKTGSVASSQTRVQKPSNIKIADNSATVYYGSKGQVNIYRRADGTIGATHDGLGGKSQEYIKNALELPEVKARFADGVTTPPKTKVVAPIQKLKQEMATLNEELQKVKSQLDTATSEAEVMRLYDRKDAINTRLRQIVDTDVPLAEMQNSGVKNASEKMRIKNIDEQIQRGVNESDTRRLLDEKQAITEKLDAEILAQETKTRNAAHQKYVKETNAKFDNDLRKLKEIAPNKELTPQSKKLFDDLEKQWKDLPEKRGDSFTGYIMEQYGKAQPTSPKTVAPKGAPIEKTPTKMPNDPLESLKAEARKYKSAEEFVRAQGTRITEVRDKSGLKLQDPYTAEYLPTNSDGTVTLYHSTTKEGAEKIKESGIFGSKTEGGDIYFTTNKKGYGGIGKDKEVVLAFNVDPKKVKFDDVYRGELHLKGNNADIGGIKPVEIKTTSQLTDLYNQATAPKTKGVVPDPLKVAEKRTNKGLKELSDIRKQYANDQEFFDKVILENQDAKGEIGDFARHIARRDATEGSIYNKNYLTEILDDELAPLNSKLDQSIAKTAQRDELAKTVRDFEKSTGQKGLYKKVAQAMQGMNEREQIDFMGKALKDMRDNGLMAADYLNKQNGYTPKTPPVGKTAPKTEGVVPTGKTYIVPKTNSTDVTKLTDKDLQYFGKQGYTAITDRFGNTRQIAPVATDGVKKLDNLNPTGGVYVDYDPKARATMPLADNITTLDKTAGKSPDELVTIYRGAPSNQKSINAGDFITTNKELAKSYTGDGNVLEMKVPASHILDDLDSPLGEEYLYRPTTKPLPPKTPPVAKTTPTISKTETVAPVEKTSPFEKALPQASDQKINGLSKTQPQQSPEISSPAQKIESQATQGQEIKVAEPFPASRTSNQKAASSYSNNTPIVNNKMDKKAYQEVFGVDGKTAMKDLDKNGNPIDRAYKDPKKLAKQLAEIDRQDKTTQLNRAAREAQATGKEFHFFGKMDKNGRSVGIEAYNPDKHRIEAGLVLNKNGDVLGNHIKIDETGIATGVGGTYHNVTDVFGEVDKWGNKYRITETLERNVMNNAPDKETGKKVVKWLIHSKNKNEAAMKTAARSMMQKNNARYKAVMSGKPITTRKATVMADSMAYGEGKLTKQDITAKYGENYGSTITSNMDEMRLDYDNYLDQINKVRKQYGQDVIPKRKDYITHVQELNSSQSFAGEVFGDLKNSIAGEGMETTRGAVPADIAGRTENFKPKSKWNPFLQQRTGSQNYVKNPFEAFDRYILPAEHNIHMTESVTRARVAEEVFRAAKNFDNLDKQNLGKLITDDLQKAAGDAVPDSLTKGFMEYANALAGKTNRLDRTVMDWSPATAKGVKGWQALQRTAGRATIPGNIKSIMMQPLSQVNVFSQVSIPSYTKGMAKWLKNDKIIELSPFIKARQTTVDSMFRNKLGKATDAASVPLQKVEMQSVKLAWYAQYEDALRKGLKGADAVAEADRLTERAVSGRGIGDKPELYRSTVTNGLLQYTLEVMGQSKMFWKDLTPAQKVKWMAGAAAINTMYAFVANDKPLPDYIDAAYESYKDFADPEDDRSGLEKVGGTAQRFAGETVKFNPIASKVAQSLPKNVKTSVFGSDSDVTRYDGAAAATRVLSNWWDAGVAVKDGDLVTARNKALKTMPVGNQAEKSLTGAEMLARGYDINDKGERTFDAPTGFVDKSRAVLFGPNATNAAKEYYANPQGYSSSQKKKTDAKFGIPTKMTLEESKVYTKKRIENAFGKEYADMNQDELKAIANTDSNAAEALQMYDSNKGAFGAGAKLPESLKSEPARKVLDRAYRTTTEDWGNQKNTIKEVNDSLKQWNNGKDLPEITNEVAKDWAEYQKDFAEGKISKMKADDKKKSILKKAYNSQLNEDEREIYKFSEAEIRDGLTRGLLTEENVKKALAIEKQLFDAKLITKETLAKKLDQPARGYKTSSRTRRSSSRSRSTRRSSGSSSVFTPIPQSAYSMSGIYSQVSSKQKKLRDLLQAAKV